MVADDDFGAQGGDPRRNASRSESPSQSSKPISTLSQSSPLDRR